MDKSNIAVNISHILRGLFILFGCKIFSKGWIWRKLRAGWTIGPKRPSWPPSQKKDAPKGVLMLKDMFPINYFTWDDRLLTTSQIPRKRTAGTRGNKAFSTD